MKIQVDKISSTLKNIKLPNKVIITKHLNSLEGEVVLVEAQEAQNKYGELELTSGRMAKIYKGDLIAGVLGARKALAGIVGIVPKTINPDDKLQILNLGGVIGKAISWNKDIVTKPITVKVIGGILDQNHHNINIHNFKSKSPIKLNKKGAPLIVIAGTAMNSGKTTVATELIHFLVEYKNLKVVAAKLTGVATQKDLLAMKDAGAVKILSFHDLGLTSTLNNHNSVIPIAKTILNKLNEIDPDIIVVELGDGIIGWYGVDKLLSDEEFVNAINFTVVCAQDLVGAKGAIDVLSKANLTVNFFSGPVTNNTAGTDYLEQKLNIPAQDLRSDKTKLIKTLIAKGVISND